MKNGVTNPRTARRSRVSRHRGFTLIEAALTTVIVGTGVLAIVAAQQAYHAKNNWAQRTGTAMLLANELRELTMALPLKDPQDPDSTGVEPEEYSGGAPDVRKFDDLDDFAGEIDAMNMGEGLTFSPPINGLRDEVPDMDGWSQEIRVNAIWADEISTTYDDFLPLTDPEAVRVEVTVKYQSPRASAPEPITTLSWVVTK